MSIAALRQQLAEIVEGGRPAMPGLATGMAALDAVLPGHGLPRGRLTEITGAPGSGRTTIARQLVAATLQAGWWVAYVDAARTLAPRDWAALGAHDGLWIVRPDDSSRGAWCADVLLRSGAFGLVVLDGAPALSRPVAVRLVRLARASDAAFVLLAPDGQHAGVAGALQLRVQRVRAKRKTEPLDLTARLDGQSRAGAGVGAGASTGIGTPARPQSRRLFITIEKGGPAQRVEVECASDEVRHAARRVREDPQVPDRRGVARRDVSRRGVRAGSAGERGIRSGATTALGRTTPRPA
ncbi:MAG: P-loop NTPase family protein [Gemmatimonadaceae bacterium]